MKPTRAKIAIAVIAALVIGIMLALVHGDGSNATLYRDPGQRPAQPG
jgi:hypothetical protein